MPIAHTARFLQTFHTGRTAAQRTENAGTEAHTDQRDLDPSAVAFVRGQAAVRFDAPRADSTYLADIKGWKVLQGGSNLTEKQAEYVISIAETREGVTDGMLASLRVRLEQGFAKRAASEFITTYGGMPKKSAEPATAPVRDAQGVAAGRYALESADGVKFYRVTLGKGRWAGRTFVEAQASDDHWPIKNPIERERILKAIAANPLEAAQRYGQKLGKCSTCNRTLTDETSRSFGIGPECRKK